MSKQLTVSAIFSVFATAAFVLSVAGLEGGDGESMMLGNGVPSTDLGFQPILPGLPSGT